MYRLFFFLLFITVTSLAANGQTASFQGKWSLDQKLSTGLPEYYAGIKSHLLAIDQNASTLKVGVTIEREGNAPDALTFDYKLDGSATTSQTPVRTPKGLVNVPTTLTAKATGPGKLHISILREVTMPNSTFKGLTTEDWELGSDGKTLRIHKIDETPRGKLDSLMVFTKMQ